MKTLLIAFISCVLTPKPVTKPTIKSQDKTGYYTATNPSKRWVRFWMDCGPDWSLQSVDLKPQETQEVNIQEPGGKGAFCTLDRVEYR